MIHIENKILEGYTFIDLFAGIGSFRLTLDSLGARCVYSNEWDREAQKDCQILAALYSYKGIVP